MGKKQRPDRLNPLRGASRALGARGPRPEQSLSAFPRQVNKSTSRQMGRVAFVQPATIRLGEFAFRVLGKETPGRRAGETGRDTIGKYAEYHTDGCDCTTIDADPAVGIRFR